MFATQNASFKHPPLQILNKIFNTKRNLSYHAPCLWICLPLAIIQENIHIFNSLDEINQLY